MEIIDNAIPHIGGEETKMETESRKLLGEFDGAELTMHDSSVNASCNRIPTLDGHLESVFVDLDEEPSPAEARDALESFPGIDLPSAPDQLIHVFGEDQPDRPQPRLDRNRDNGMAISAGGVPVNRHRPESTTVYRPQHTPRAAGASVLNGELRAYEKGWI